MIKPATELLAESTVNREKAVFEFEQLVDMSIASASNRGDFKCKVKISLMAVAINCEDKLNKLGYITRIRRGHNGHFLSIYWEHPTV